MRLIPATILFLSISNSLCLGQSEGTQRKTQPIVRKRFNAIDAIRGSVVQIRFVGHIGNEFVAKTLGSGFLR